MLFVGLQPRFAAMPSVWFNDLDAEQSGEAFRKLDIDSEWQDSQPSAVYHQWFLMDETVRAVPLTSCTLDVLYIEAVIITIESCIELPSADIALGSATKNS